MERLIGQTLGKYQILEQVGRGGMATVFKAFQPGLDRIVAVKILPAYYAHEAGFTERFIQEARAIARLDHPHILPVYDFGQSEDLSYIVMKYVAAGTLKDRLGQPLSTKEALGILRQIAVALDHAHDVGILHRDVKPGNILIDEKEWIYLSDFGLAKMAEGSLQLTGTGVGVGTPAYMSPEQGQGLTVDARTDVYSVGVILYEMLTGRVPFDAETPMAVVVKHIASPLPLPRSVNPTIPEAVERVILKALAKAPADRFGYVGELVDALEAAIVQAKHEPHVAMSSTSSAPGLISETQVASPNAGLTVAPPPSQRVTASAKPRGLPLIAIGGIAGALTLVGTALAVALIVLLGRNGASDSQVVVDSGRPTTVLTPSSEGMSLTITPTATSLAVTQAEPPQPTATETAPATPVASATAFPTSTPQPTYTPLATYTLLPTLTVAPTSTPLPPTFTPTPIPLRGRLVFSRNPGSQDLSDNEIHTYDIQRGVTTRLTNNTSNDWIPRWSPDGRYIAFTSNRDNTDTSNYDVWVMNADGSNPQRYIATDAWDEYSAWSPLNNGEIAIATTADNNSEIHFGTNVEVLRRLTFNTDRDEWPTYSPDGKRIAYSSYQYGKGDIFVTDVSSGATEWLFGTEGDDNQPAWSPDGRWIVFVQRTDSQDAFGELVVISADGSSQSRQLTPAHATNPTWSPDSQWIVFARGVDSNTNGELDKKDETDLWAIELASGTLVPLVQAPGIDFAPSWIY